MIQRFVDMRKRQQEGGFTLIELLVVIIILGILAAVVVFAVGGINDRGEESACTIDTRTLRTSEEAFAAQNSGRYTDEAGLVSGGFLSEQSDYHEITDVVADNPSTRDVNEASFTIRVQDPQCGVTTPGAPPGTDNVVDADHPNNR